MSAPLAPPVMRILTQRLVLQPTLVGLYSPNYFAESLKFLLLVLLLQGYLQCSKYSLGNRMMDGIFMRKIPQIADDLSKYLYFYYFYLVLRDEATIQ